MRVHDWVLSSGPWWHYYRSGLLKCCSTPQWSRQNVDAQISLSAMCRLTIGRGWVEPVLMGCWAQNSKPGPWTCLMADGALLPDLLLCLAFLREDTDLLWKPPFFVNSRPTADRKRDFPFLLITRLLQTANINTHLPTKSVTADSKRKYPGINKNNIKWTQIS